MNRVKKITDLRTGSQQWDASYTDRVLTKQVKAAMRNTRAVHRRMPVHELCGASSARGRLGPGQEAPKQSSALRGASTGEETGAVE
jgi:hypothetical protein